MQRGPRRCDANIATQSSARRKVEVDNNNNISIVEVDRMTDGCELVDVNMTDRQTDVDMT